MHIVLYVKVSVVIHICIAIDACIAAFVKFSITLNCELPESGVHVHCELSRQIDCVYESAKNDVFVSLLEILEQLRRYIQG